MYLKNSASSSLCKSRGMGYYYYGIKLNGYSCVLGILFLVTKIGFLLMYICNNDSEMLLTAPLVLLTTAPALTTR